MTRLALLLFLLSTRIPEFPSVSVIFGQNPITRLDVVRDDEAHDNPPWAAGLGLPPSVSGPHCHTWAANRAHVKATGIWELPARQQANGTFKRVSHIVPWIADSVGISLESHQRQFEAPPRSDLFEGIR